MRCCICGNEIENFGNNPFPLCNKEDYESRCCDMCDNKVIQARLILHKYPLVDKIITPDGENVVDVGDTIVIFYSNNSENPTQIINDTGKFLSGTVESIDLEYGLIFGDWGNIAVDLNKDVFCKVED